MHGFPELNSTTLALSAGRQLNRRRLGHPRHSEAGVLHHPQDAVSSGGEARAQAAAHSVTRGCFTPGGR